MTVSEVICNYGKKDSEEIIHRANNLHNMFGVDIQNAIKIYAKISKLKNK